MVAGERLVPLVVIVGQTGSGKSALAMELAARFDGEIIAADSRTVYKGMDIGTAKPSLEDRQTVSHYCLDVVEPGEMFTAADFKRIAANAIYTIAGKGKLPFVVGGTGLYVDALLYDFSFRPAPDGATRTLLDTLSVEELQKRIIAAGLLLPQNSTNPRHLRRLLESGPVPVQPKKLRPNTLIFGLRVQRDGLRERISKRVDQMVINGLVDETRVLISRYGEVEALRTPGYTAFGCCVRGECNLDEAKRAFVAYDMQLAKRQLTWFKRNQHIHWIESDAPLAEAVPVLRAFLDTASQAFDTINL